MRKIDYKILADIIRAEILASLEQDTPAKRSARAECAVSIAENFAAHAHVNKPEFLRACGLE